MCKSLHLAGRLITNAANTANTVELLSRVSAGKEGFFLSFVSVFSIHAAAFNILDIIKFHFLAFHLCALILSIVISCLSPRLPPHCYASLSAPPSLTVIITQALQQISFPLRDNFTVLLPRKGAIWPNAIKSPQPIQDSEQLSC